MARIAKRHGKPVIGIAGCLTADVGVVHAHGIDAVFSVLYRPCTVAEAFAEASDNVRLTSRNIAAAVKLGVALTRRAPQGAATEGGASRRTCPAAGKDEEEPDGAADRSNEFVQSATLCHPNEPKRR